MRILIVEDHDATVRLLTRSLKTAGHEVLSAGMAEDALIALGKERFDAILLDDLLPGMMGIRAMAEIQRISRAPIFFMTGFPSEELREDAMALGARAFMEKPIDLSELNRELSRITSKD